MTTSLYILIGPKGSGKSYIGDLVERRLGIPFFRVEPIFMAIRGGRRPDDPEYIREGFAIAGEEIRGLLDTHEEVLIESTGTATEFWSMLERLGGSHRRVPIRVDAPFDLCLERIRSRDQSRQIPVPDELIRRMDELSRRVRCDFAATIVNVDLPDDGIVDRITSLREAE